MKAIGLVFLLVIGALPCVAQDVDDWRHDRTCVGEHGPGVLRLRPSPRLTTPGDHSSPACTMVDGHARICAQLVEEPDLVEVRFSLSRDGRELRSWRRDYAMASESDFTVLVGDLDLDGKSEIILARILGVGNGLGIAYWRLAVFDGRDWLRPPLEFDVEDFSPTDSFRRAGDLDPCAFVVSEWCGGIDPRRGWGFYLVGQRFQYREGHLVPDRSRPVVARRLLFSFFEELEQGGPGTWLASPKAEARARHWIDEEPRVLELEGTLSAISGDRVTLVLDDSDGATICLEQAWTAAPGGSEFTRFGDLASGRLFPVLGTPLDAARDLVGRHVLVVFLPDVSERVLWLDAAGTVAR